MAEKSEKLTWMYDGKASLVDREDYLTGRKIDKNFDMADGSGGTDGAELSRAEAVARGGRVVAAPTAARPGASSKSMLDLDTIRKEDPLVAIKVKEDRIRRDIVENPLRMKRLQKIVMSAMEKKMKKVFKQEYREMRDRARQTTKERSRSRSPADDTQRRRRRSPENTAERRHRMRRSPDEPARQPRRPPSSPDASDSDDERRRTRWTGYGLVKKRAASPPAPRRDGPPKPKYDRRAERRATGANSEPVVASSSSSSSRGGRVAEAPRRKLTADELEARRKEMLVNADWRESQRSRNLKRQAAIEAEEKRRNERTDGDAGDFIRPLLAAAAESGTVESRVKSNIHNIQRRHGAMESNFAKK